MFLNIVFLAAFYKVIVLTNILKKKKKDKELKFSSISFTVADVIKAKKEYSSFEILAEMCFLRAI